MKPEPDNESLDAFLAPEPQPEGQTSLHDAPAGLPGSSGDWEALSRLAEQQERDHRPSCAPETANLSFSVLDEIIDSLPAEHEQGELAPGLGAEAPPKRTPLVPLRVVNGWPDRYAGDLDEPEGPEWKAHFALALPVIEAGGILMATGGRGTGKTRMAAEIARLGRYPADRTKTKAPARGDIPATGPVRTPLYRSAMDYFLDLRATYNRVRDTGRSEKEVIAELADCAFLVLDEIQERGESGWEDRMLIHLVDRRYRAMLPTMLISNLKKEAFQDNLGNSIISRAQECGRLLEFKHPSFRSNNRKFR